MLFGGIIAEDQDGRGGHGFAQGSGAVLMAGEGACKGGVVGGAVVVDVVGAEHGAGEFLQEVVFFVGGAVGAENSYGLAALDIADFAQLAAGVRQGLLPTDFCEFAVWLADERLGQAVGVVGKVKSIAAFDAQEVTVDTA